jgi:hypothetical protein
LRICVLTLPGSRKESSDAIRGDLVRYGVFPIVCLSKGPKMSSGHELTVDHSPHDQVEDIR